MEGICLPVSLGTDCLFGDLLYWQFILPLIQPFRKLPLINSRFPAGIQYDISQYVIFIHI